MFDPNKSMMQSSSCRHAALNTLSADYPHGAGATMFSQFSRCNFSLALNVGYCYAVFSAIHERPPVFQFLPCCSPSAADAERCRLYYRNRRHFVLLLVATLYRPTLNVPGRNFFFGNGVIVRGSLRCYLGASTNLRHFCLYAGKSKSCL